MEDNVEKLVGIGYFVVHDSNVAVTSPNQPLFACSEDRLTRVKRDGSIPTLSLNIAKKIVPNNVTMVCSYYDTPQYLKYHENIQDSSRVNVDLNIRHTKQLREIGVTEFVGHHFSHAAGAYLTSGFDEAIAITYDAGIVCEPWLATFWKCSNNQMQPICKITRLDGAVAAIRYSGVTSLLGYKPVFDEGKVTGLAAAGNFRDDCMHDLTMAFRQSDEPHCYWSGKFASDFSWIQERYSPEDVAATIQYMTEESILSLIKQVAPSITGKNCVLAGGLFANVKLNQRIKQLGFKNLYVYPAMGDSGLGLGAALGYLSQHKKVAYELPHAYLGVMFSNDQIRDVLDNYGVDYTTPPRLEETIAKLLAEGFVVARFNGAMEYGPRALGNRSILYQTTDKTITQWLNQKLNRTRIMPFAPVTLQEYAHEMYKDLDGIEKCTKFMTISVDCTNLMRSVSPGAVHLDGTARPQIIEKKVNPCYHEIVYQYYKQTGIPSLINTSFNMHGEPIVCSPEDAIKSLFKSNIEFLAIGSYLVKNFNSTS